MESMDPLTAAIALVCQFSPAGLCPTVQSVSIEAVAPDTVCPIHAPACGDAQHIWYVPAALAIHNPELSEADEIALALAKEAGQVDQARVAPFGPATCVQEETVGHQDGLAFWTWLWVGNPPHVVYNRMEEALAFDASGALASNVSYTCRTLFG